MKQCADGHIYDETKYSECPYCSGGVSVRPLAGGNASFLSTVPLGLQAAPAPQSKPNKKKEMGVTVALNATDAGIDPVTGWLVVIDGEKKGMSFTVHGERNTIGRGSDHDINIYFDKSLSKSGDAVISYDTRRSRFHISVLEGKNNVYLNNEILLRPEMIKDYDIIEIGETRFVFRSLCNEQFTY